MDDRMQECWHVGRVTNIICQHGSRVRDSDRYARIVGRCATFGPFGKGTRSIFGDRVAFGLDSGARRIF